MFFLNGCVCLHADVCAESCQKETRKQQKMFIFSFCVQIMWSRYGKSYADTGLQCYVHAVLMFTSRVYV